MPVRLAPCDFVPNDKIPGFIHPIQWLRKRSGIHSIIVLYDGLQENNTKAGYAVIFGNKSQYRRKFIRKVDQTPGMRIEIIPGRAGKRTYCDYYLKRPALRQ